MPSRNRVKKWAEEQVYHLYNRGNNGRQIFLDDDDYAVFLHLLKRHLAKKPSKDLRGRTYKNWYGSIELLGFCLMPNHFHLLMFQVGKDDVSKLMSSVATSYAGYFNNKYHRTGRLFQDIFKASLVDEEVYWQHISRYIHLNPKEWRTWEWSSLPYYLGQRRADWVQPNRILKTFETSDYEKFVEDYHAHKEALDELKYVTAD